MGNAYIAKHQVPDISGLPDPGEFMLLGTYARRLCRYMRDASKVRSHCLREYGRSPTIEQIETMIKAANPRPVALHDHDEEPEVAPTPVSNVLVFRDPTKPEPEPAPAPKPAPPIFINRGQRVLAAASKLTELSATMLLGERRSQQYTRPRFAMAYVLFEAGYSFPRIGAALNRDHTTIMHAVERARYLIVRDMAFEHMVFVLRQAARVPSLVIGA
jgi:hypothetical protein